MGVRAASWALGALVVGSVVVVDPSGLAPFGPAKWCAISTLALLGGGLALRSGKRSVHRRSLVAWFALLGLLAVGALVGGDLPTALLGQPDRHLGLITWLLFLLLFCAGQQLTGEADRVVLVRSAAVATLCFGVWAAWELAFGAPIKIDSNTDRLTGPFGSAAFLGAAACLLVPVSAGIALDRTGDRRWRVLATLAALLGTLALLGSGSRSAWLASGAVLIVVIVRTRPSRRMVAACALALVAAVACVTPRFDDVLDRSHRAASRLDEWAVASRVIGDASHRRRRTRGLSHRSLRGHRSSLRAHLRSRPGAARPGTQRAARRRVGRRDRRSTPLLHAGRLRVLAFVPAVERSRSGAGRRGGRPRRLLGSAAAAVPAGRARSSVVVVRRCGRGRTGTGSGHRSDAAVRPAVGRGSAHSPSLRSRWSPVCWTSQPIDWRGGRWLQPIRPTPSRGPSEPSPCVPTTSGTALSPPAGWPIEGRWPTSTRPFVRPGVPSTGRHAIRSRPINTRHCCSAEPASPVIRPMSRAALRAWQVLVERDPLRARWQIQLGRAAAAAGDLQLARSSWTIAADLAPDDPTASNLLDALGAP